MMTVPIVFCIHDANGHYWPNLAVAIESVLVNSSGQHAIHVLHNETMTQEAKETIQLIASSHGAKLHLTNIKLTEFLEKSNYGQFSPASIFRLAIPLIFKDEDQVVYLDSDLIFHGVDINDLISSASNSAICAVTDPYIGRSQAHRELLAELSLDASSYFNSGVLVMRPKKMDPNLMDIFISFYKNNPVLGHPDQDFLNFQFKDNWSKLDAKFNHQACAFDRSLFKPISSDWGKVIHYAGKVKPLQGFIAPAFIPFWMYANVHVIEKATQVFDAAPLLILEPDPSNDDFVLGHQYKS